MQRWQWRSVHLHLVEAPNASNGNNWTASSEFGTYRLCEQRRFRRACASAQSRQNLRCSLIQAVNQEQPSDRKPDLWPLWMAGHAQLKFVMTECSKTQIRLTGLNCCLSCIVVFGAVTTGPCHIKIKICICRTWRHVSTHPPSHSSVLILI